MNSTHMNSTHSEMFTRLALAAFSTLALSAHALPTADDATPWYVHKTFHTFTFRKGGNTWCMDVQEGIAPSDGNGTPVILYGLLYE